jgi:hypothetical protein
VARASSNELLAAFLYSVSYGVAIATTTAENETMVTRKEVIRIHARINAFWQAKVLKKKRMAIHYHRRLLQARGARQALKAHFDRDLAEIDPMRKT